MAIYTVPFAAVAVTAAQDLWEIVAPTGSRIAILAVEFGQISDAGDAAAEILGVRFTRGMTVSGSGGSTVTPKNTSGLTNALASAITSVEVNNTTQANTTGVDIFSTVWNVQVPFVWKAGQYQDEIIKLEIAQRFTVAITAPADSLTMYGTLTYEELGQ